MARMARLVLPGLAHHITQRGKIVPVPVSMLNNKNHLWGLVCVVALSVAGCAVAQPYVPQGGPATISRGQPIPPVDLLGNVFALFSKLLFLNWKVGNHAISHETEDSLTRYLEAPNSMTEGTHFSLNEYAPSRALNRLVMNRKVAWPYRLVLGLPVTLVRDVLLPGRLFAGLVGGDSYNPFTDTVSLYSDLPAIALHEAGHARDSNRRRLKGSYAALRLVPFVDLYQEYQATKEAIDYLQRTNDLAGERSAYHVLYPAYGTYVGAYVFPPIGTIGGAVLGHVVGRSKAFLMGEPSAAQSVGVERLVVADFNQGGWRTNTGEPFGTWDHDPADSTQFCRARLVEEPRVGGVGYSLQLEYDVDSPNPAFNGFWMKLPSVPVRQFRMLSIAIKGDEERGFSRRVKLELKDEQRTATYLLDGIQAAWLRLHIPLTAFTDIEAISAATEFVIVFDDATVTRKVGALYLDDVALELAP